MFGGKFLVDNFGGQVLGEIIAGNAIFDILEPPALSIPHENILISLSFSAKTS